MSGALVFTAAAQGMPFDQEALVTRRTCTPRSHRTVAIRETVIGRIPSSGHCTQSRLKSTPNISVKGAYLLVLEDQLWSRLPVWHTSRDLGGTIRKCRSGNTIFILSLYYTIVYENSPERSLYTHLEPHFWQVLSRGHFQFV